MVDRLAQNQIMVVIFGIKNGVKGAKYKITEQSIIPDQVPSCVIFPMPWTITTPFHLVILSGDEGLEYECQRVC